MSKRLIIVDISSFIFRAFYAIRPLTAPNGTPVNAVYGVLSMLLKLFTDFRPTHLMIARDGKDGSFRNELYPQYKMNRSEPPEDLIPQFQIIQNLIQLLGLPHIIMKNYEADDIIGSVVKQWKDQFDEIYIATGDKDLMQFVGHNVYMLDTRIDKIYGSNDVFEKMGVYPEQIVDYLSMIGDSSDNIPGMKGIGAKGAAKLLAEYKTLDQCIAAKESFKDKRVKGAFENYLQDGLLSRKLVQIVVDLELNSKIFDSKFSLKVTAELLQFLEDLGFKSQVKKIQELKMSLCSSEGESEDVESGQLEISTMTEKSEEKFAWQKLNTEEEIQALLEKTSIEKEMAIFAEYDLEEKIVSLSLSFDGQSSYFISFCEGLEKLERKILEVIWNQGNLLKISSDIKKDVSYLLKQNIPFSENFFDISQSHYLIDVATKHDLDLLAKKYLDIELCLSLDDSNDKSGRERFCGERVCCIYLLKQIFKEKLTELKLEKVFYEMDNALIPVLAQMEKEGICVDLSYFAELEKVFLRELKEYEQKVEMLGHETVNLRSPKQVAQLLFEKLSLPVIKKNKTGSSTDVEVLEELDALGTSEVPGLILRFRGLEKLLSTYVSVLPQLADPETKRIHTTFNQTVTATGRLSSDRPNLQNIPIKTENGKKVRRGFVACPGNFLFSADYSQVELRILAHFSGDQSMMNAFLHNQDIHVQTAAEVLGVPLELVTMEQRSKAKAINFGLIYGQSSFGLAKTLKISRNEAKNYITQYFAKFHRIKAFLDSLRERCSETGYAETLFGRKRFLPDINSQNRTIKAFAERMAINSPIQGTAADIIKLAMLQISKLLKERRLESKLLLQVHDELIFEVPEKELEIIQQLVVEQMEGAVSLNVPLKVDVGVGKNWMDLK